MGAAMSRKISNHDQPIHRGPSNASSAYSTGPDPSHPSDDAVSPQQQHGAPGQYYHEEGPYHYNEAPQQPGGYAEPAYGSDQPVIRDVAAKRYTRVEKAPTFNQPGNPSIAKNF